MTEIDILNTRHYYNPETGEITVEAFNPDKRKRADFSDAWEEKPRGKRKEPKPILGMREKGLADSYKVKSFDERGK